MSVLCLGETLVDLFCERPVADFAQADAFVPHSGGAPANAAVVASRCGARTSLGSGVGDDAWGRWLHARLRAEGVGLDWFTSVPGLRTPLAFVVERACRAGLRDLRRRHRGLPAVVEGRLEEAVMRHDAVLIGSNTLLGARERELTLRSETRSLRASYPTQYAALVGRTPRRPRAS
jgi:hypothetical protein